MAVIKKSDLKRLSQKEVEAKIFELEKSLLELKGEGKVGKIKPVKKAIASLLTKQNSFFGELAVKP